MAKIKPIATVGTDSSEMTSQVEPMARVYLDHNATSPLRPCVRAAMIETFDADGNPSSVHADGRKARSLVERARGQVARAIGCRPQDVFFTSGATEAAQLVLSGAFGCLPGEPCDALLTNAGEHACVLSGHGFAAPALFTFRMQGDGSADLQDLERLLESGAAVQPLVALQAANNETGAIQPTKRAAELARAHNGVLICDAVQALGRIPCGFDALGADALFFSAHKIGGPKGVGALVFNADRLHIQGGSKGGGQERGVRAGTENVAGIVGFGAACEEIALMDGEAVRQRGLRDRLEQGVKAVAADAWFWGAETDRLCNTSCFSVPGTRAETLLIALDLAGAAVSSGSACSSGKVKSSHVLAAMGVAPEMAAGALRASLGWSSVESDVDRFCEAFEKTLRTVRPRSVGRAA